MDKLKIFVIIIFLIFPLLVLAEEGDLKLDLVEAEISSSSEEAISEEVIEKNKIEEKDETIEKTVVLSPTIIDEKAKAKGILKYDLKLKNNTGRYVSLYPIVNDISMSGGRQEFLDPGDLDRTTSLARWIRISRGVIEIPPGETKEISLEINVSLYAVPGKRYASIAFPEGNNRTIAQANMLKLSFPELRLNVEVIEDIVEKAQVMKFATLKKTYFSFPVVFDLDIRNFGNKDIVSSGRIYIYNRRGEEVINLAVNEKFESIKPEETKNWQNLWSEGGKIGKFKAKLELEYGQGERRDLQDTIYFWVMPWYLLLIFLIGITAFIIIISVIVFKKTYHTPPTNSGKNYQPKESEGVLDLRDE